MPVPAESRLVACHECDHLHHSAPIAEGARALCTQCGSLLYRQSSGVDTTLALYIAALILMIIANSFPFLSLQIGGRAEHNILISGALALHQLGMSELGLLVFLTSVFFPIVVIVGMLYLLLPVRMGFTPPYKGQVYRLVNALQSWSLIGVFVLGVLIAIVKLLDLAEVIPGIALYAMFALLIIMTTASIKFEPSNIWPHRKQRELNLKPDGKTAAEQQLLNCHTCAYLVPMSARQSHCPRCHTPLHSRKHNSLARTWALIFTAVILLIPANIYPIMTVIRFGQGAPDTILSGVVHLIEGGMWPLALIVFFASIFVPFLKLIVLSLLAVTVQRRSNWRKKDRTLLYRVTEVIGAWSMVDIFLIGLLAALVNLGALATIRPGVGATFFAAAVIITIFAAHSFDPRLIWDNARKASD
ncbi:MAG: paraquat-inducible protein A [Gammaproteobacteria bacterium]|nr:paraquat-inducible protein A [Gammaproteobacteria bacterium]